MIYVVVALSGCMLGLFVGYVLGVRHSAYMMRDPEAPE